MFQYYFAVEMVRDMLVQSRAAMHDGARAPPRRRRSEIAQSRVRPALVVIGGPVGDRAPSMFEPEEQGLV
jgi:hypothetical protein